MGTWCLGQVKFRFKKLVPRQHTGTEDPGWLLAGRGRKSSPSNAGFSVQVTQTTAIGQLASGLPEIVFKPFVPRPNEVQSLLHFC